MRRIIKHLDTHDFLGAYHKLDTVQTRLTRACLQAGLRLTATTEYVIDGGFTLHYDVSYSGEVGSIFSGNLVIGDEYNVGRLLDILSGKLTSEVCPPAIQSIPREDDAPEIVSYWRRRLIVEQDITHVGSRKEQTTAAQSAAWIGFNAKGLEIVRVVDGSRNHDVGMIKRVQYVDMGNGDVVVAVMYHDDEPKDEKLVSLGQAIELSEKQNKAKPEEVFLPPLLKPAEYDTLGQSAKDDYNASISKVAHAIIQDVAGVVRDGNPEHLVWLRRVLDNGHMESEAAGSVEGEKFNSKTVRDYMVEKLQISAVMLQSMYPDENIIDDNRAEGATGAQSRLGQRMVPAGEHLEPFKTDIENYHMHSGWVANAVRVHGLFPGLEVKETYWLYSLIHSAWVLMGDVMASATVRGFLDLSDENQKTFLHCVHKVAQRRKITEGKYNELLAAFSVRVQQLRQAQKLSNGEPTDAPTVDIITTARDWGNLSPGSKQQYTVFVKHHADIAFDSMKKTEPSAFELRSRVVIERVLAAKALSAAFRQAVTSQKTLEDYTAFYFRISVDLVKFLKESKASDFLIDTVSPPGMAPKPAGKRAPARKKLSDIVHSSPALWTLDKFNQQSDLTKNMHIEQWRAFMKKAMTTLNRVEQPEKQRSLLSAVRFLVTAGYLAKQHKEDLSHLAQTSSVEWYTAQSFGIDRITFALASDLMDPPLSEKPPVKELPAKRGALQVTGRVPMKSVTLRNKATGVTLKVAAKKKPVTKKK